MLLPCFHHLYQSVTSTEITTVFSVSTGFGVNVTDLMTGALVSSFTVLVTVVLFPALSVATTVMVLVPSVRVITLDQEPSEATVAASALPLFSLTVTDTGLDVASFVVPRTVQEAWLVTRPSD